MMDTLLRDILTSRVYDVAQGNAARPGAAAVAPFRQRVLLKREDLQPIFSFKIRGAYNRMARLSAEERGAASSRPARATTRRASPTPRPGSASAP